MAKKSLDSLRGITTGAVLISAITATNSNAQEPKDNAPVIKEYQKPVRKNKDYQTKPEDFNKDIYFQRDTVADFMAGSAAYDPRTNTITSMVGETEKTTEEYSELNKRLVLIHEQKHKDNALDNLRSGNMTIEQYYKICMHDEVSANIATLIAMREEYLKTGDIRVFYDTDFPEFSFYGDAIQDGSIKTNSKNKDEFDEEMSLIANGTLEMWENDIALLYASTHVRLATIYEMNGNNNEKADDTIYQQNLKKCYGKNLGGIDFSKYLTDDILVSEDAMTAIERNKEIAKHKFKNNMSLEQWETLNKNRERAFYIKKAMENISSDKNANLSEKDKKDIFETAVTNFNLRLIYTVYEDITQNATSKLVNTPQANDKSFNQEMKEIYTINGVDFSALAKETPLIEKTLESSKAIKEFNAKNWKQRFNDLNRNRFKSKKIKLPPRTPKYEKWSKDRRVSSPEKINILDLSKDIINKPNNILTNEMVFTITKKREH